MLGCLYLDGTQLVQQVLEYWVAELNAAFYLDKRGNENKALDQVDPTTRVGMAKSIQLIKFI